MKHLARLLPLLLPLVLFLPDTVTAHPLGNFAVSHYLRVATETARVRLHYVVDYAEIAAFQELQTLDTNRDGIYSSAEKTAWLARHLPQWLAGLRLTANDQPLSLRARNQTLNLLPGAVKLLTMRVECDFEAPFALAAVPVRFALTDDNHPDRQGWREIVLQPAAGVLVFDSTAFGDSRSDELRAYPENDRQAPLDERQAAWSVTLDALPAQAQPLLTRAGQPVFQSRSRFAGWFKPLAYACALGLLLYALSHWLRQQVAAGRVRSWS